MPPAAQRARGQDEDLHPESSITVGRALEAWLEVADLAATTRERYEDAGSHHADRTRRIAMPLQANRHLLDISSLRSSTDEHSGAAG